MAFNFTRNNDVSTSYSIDEYNIVMKKIKATHWINKCEKKRKTERQSFLFDSYHQKANMNIYMYFNKYINKLYTHCFHFLAFDISLSMRSVSSSDMICFYNVLSCNYNYRQNSH